MNTGPIFIRGLSRSGGTLIVTLLDAHPDVAMSYELYPRLLDCGADGDAVLERSAVAIAQQGALSKDLDLPRDLRTFINRCIRGGIKPVDFAALVRSHQSNGYSFATDEGRYRFIEICCVAKQRAEGKKRWGLKCNNQYEQYLEFWPDAKFIDIVRDARDVVASQQVTGAFNKDIDEATTGWVRTHSHFLELVRSIPNQAYMLFYERLVADAAGETAKLCEFLDLPFEPAMLEYYKRDLTIYRASHLSMNRISRPIDASQVGRWKTILQHDDIARIDAIAGGLMATLGYQGDDDADRSERNSNHPTGTTEERTRPESFQATFREYLKGLLRRR